MKNSQGSESLAGGRPRLRRRRSDWERQDGWLRVVIIATVVALVDWCVKLLIERTVPVGDLVVVVEGKLALWHVRNPALVLGLFSDIELPSRKGIALLLGTVTVVLLVAVISRSHRLLPARRPWAWAFGGLLAGGLLGNLGERVLHWWVTDYLSIGWNGIWLPPGNIADLSILCSIPVAVLVILFEVEARSLRRRSSAALQRPLAGELNR